jgi:hypothetical protein
MRRFAQRLTRSLALAGLWLGGSARAQSVEDGAAYRASLLQKLAYTMTGREAVDVLDAAAVQDFLAGATSVDAVAAQLRTHPLFQERFAQFYLQELKIGQAASVESIIDPNGPTTQSSSTGPIEKSILNYVRGGAYWGPKVLRVAKSACNDATYTSGLYDLAFSSTTANIAGCTCAEAKLIAPYWNPQANVKVCPDVDAEAYCGANLGRCYPDGSKYAQDVKYAATMEPGVMAAKIVVEDRSWDELLTTTRGVVNGPMADFIRRFGDVYLEVQPAGSYPQRTTDPTFTSADPTDGDGWAWVERGPGHAGVLTSVAFHRSTNGWRAKANRSLQVFLCREFVASDASVPEPSDEPDLTKKPYCKQCHVVLEPMAQFFAQWPNVGNDNNYYFDRQHPEQASGSFNGVAGVGTADFAQILTHMDDYDQCAIKRAFKFVTGRVMTRQEVQTLLPSLNERFVGGGKKLFPVMELIMGSPAFTGAVK